MSNSPVPGRSAGEAHGQVDLQMLMDVITVAAFVVAVLAYLDARREARTARKGRDIMQRELSAVERNLLVQLPPAIAAVVREPDSEEARENLEEVVAESLESPRPLPNVEDDEELERVRAAIQATVADGREVELLPPAKKVLRRGPGGYVVVVGTQAHGVWSASRRLDDSFIARRLADTTQGKPFGHEERVEPSDRVLSEIRSASDTDVLYFTDTWRRKERGSQRWILRDSTGEWWLADDVYRTATAKVASISLV